MAFAVMTFDKPEGKAIRDEHRAEHMAYLESHKAKLRASGGIATDEGAFCGGLIILETDDRTEAERFAREDPFAKAGLFERTIVTRWRQAFFAFERTL